MKQETASNNKGIWGTAVGVGLVALTKMKWLIAILKFAKLSTVISLVLSLFSYGLVYGWKFGFALIYLLLTHELGHYVACKIKGIPVKPTLFIPFLGAAVRMEKLPKTAAENAFIAYMGPIFGLLSVLPAIPLYLITKEPFWLIVLSVGSLLNLFNLIPFGMLDGGKIVAGISTKLWFVGLIIMSIFVVYTKSVLAGVIAVLGIIQLWAFYSEKKKLTKKKEELATAVEAYNALCEVKESEEAFVHTFNKYADRLQSGALLEAYETYQEEVDGDNPYEECSTYYLESLKEWIDVEQENLAYRESYDTISKKSRIITLAIYIALLVLLSIGLDVSKDIIESHPEVESVFHK